MAYRFKLKDDLREGVRRIARDQIDAALKRPHEGADRAVWVHETRKAMKRIRALLRCVRSGLAPGVWRSENDAARAIARELSALRDRDVMHATLADLRGTDGKALDEAIDWFAERLSRPRKPKRAAPDTPSPEDLVADAIKALKSARRRLSRLEVSGTLADVVADGLATSQRKGREALAHIEADPSDENVHELRKAVQIYQRHQALVVAAWPARQSARIASAKELAEMLGKAQDLIVLADAVRATRATGSAREHAACLRRACRERLAALRAMAIPMAARLFAIPPKAAGVEFAASWHATVAEAHAAAEVEQPDAAEAPAPRA
jgi:CHAD domain-containing protein